MGRFGLRGQRDDCRQGRAQTEAGKQAHHHERLDGATEAGQERKYPERSDGEKQYGLPPETVGGHASSIGSEEHPQRVRAKEQT